MTETDTEKWYGDSLMGYANDPLFECEKRLLEAEDQVCLLRKDIEKLEAGNKRIWKEWSDRLAKMVKHKNESVGKLQAKNERLRAENHELRKELSYFEELSDDEEFCDTGGKLCEYAVNESSKCLSYKCKHYYKELGYYDGVRKCKQCVINTLKKKNERLREAAEWVVECDEYVRRRHTHTSNYRACREMSATYAQAFTDLRKALEKRNAGEKE